MSEHTKGPWRHHYDKYDGDSIQAGQKPMQFVVRRFQDPDTCYDVVDIPNAADARLIAAAPALLEVLEAMVAAFAGYADTPAKKEAIALSDAAIARAKGGE